MAGAEQPTGYVMYAELHAHSAFSFLDGASLPTELAASAAEHGYEALALTDHDGLWGAMEHAQACKPLGVRPIVGAELTVDIPCSTSSARGREVENQAAHLTLLVENAIGCIMLWFFPQFDPVPQFRGQFT